MDECGEVILIAGDTTIIETALDPDVTVVAVDQTTILQDTEVETTLVDNHQIIILESDGGSGPAGGIGPAGPNNLFIQPLAPVTALTTYFWIQSDLPGGGFQVWFEDGTP